MTEATSTVRLFTCSAIGPHATRCEREYWLPNSAVAAEAHAVWIWHRRGGDLYMLDDPIRVRTIDADGVREIHQVRMRTHLSFAAEPASESDSRESLEGSLALARCRAQTAKRAVEYFEACILLLESEVAE